jgi:hypothetical protein
MSFTLLLAQQQSRINTACEDYREWNRKLDHLINQIEIADAWDNDAIAKLNQELEIAENETEEAMRVWDAAIAALANIPTKEPALATALPAPSYLELKGYREEGDRTIWEPTDPSALELDDVFQNNDEPSLGYEEFDPDWWIESEEF